MAHVPRKRFGQHFLVDQHVIANIIEALQPKPADHLIEIGPGEGALTLGVLKRAKHLTAIELDRDLIPHLQAKANALGTLTVYEQDVLKVDFAQFALNQQPLRVFGNLPYNISTPLIFHLLQYVSYIADMLFMVQKEVGLRMAADPHSADYGRLSVMLQYHCKVDYLFEVDADAFIPPPKVQSCIIKLKPHSTYPLKANNFNQFSRLVKQAFSQRRKTIRNSLRHSINGKAWEDLPVLGSQRPEQLSIADFVALSNAIGE